MDFSDYVAITISARPKPASMTDREQYFNQHCNIRAMFKNVIDYVLFPEFDMNFRLHYHGVIKFSNKFQAFQMKRKLDRSIGWTLFKPLTSFEEWWKYISKEADTTRQILKIDLIAITPRHKLTFKPKTTTTYRLPSEAD